MVNKTNKKQSYFKKYNSEGPVRFEMAKTKWEGIGLLKKMQGLPNLHQCFPGALAAFSVEGWVLRWWGQASVEVCREIPPTSLCSFLLG